MKQILKMAWSTAAICLALHPSNLSAADRVEIDESEIFVMAPFEVNAERRWFYVSIEGYEILSLLDPLATRTVVERLSRDIRFAPLLIPDAIPSKFEAPCALVFQEFDNPEVMAKFRTRLPPGASIDYALFDQGDRFTAFLPETSIAALLEGRRSGVNTPLTGHLFSHFALAAPKLPPWFHEGLKLLLRNGRVKDDALTFFGPQNINPKSIPIEATLTATSLEIGALRSSWMEEYKKFERQSALLVHWGLFSEDGLRREAFMQLVSAVSREPITEDALIQYLGIGYTELDQRLDRYRNTWWRSKRTITLPDKIAGSPISPITIRPANQDEVGRILGEAYLSLARGDASIERDARYLVKARETLADAYQAGYRSPEIKIVYGMLEVEEGNDEEAQRYFEDAATYDHDRPRACYELARLRFGAARAKAGAQEKLDSDAVANIYDQLGKALEAEPAMEATYQLAIALWTASKQSPTSDQLAVLARGALAFPDNIALVLLIASIHRQHGAIEESMELGRLGLRWLGDSPTARLRQLRAIPRTARIYEMATVLWMDTDISPSRSELTWLAEGVAEFIEWPDLVYNAGWLLNEYGLPGRALEMVTLGLPFTQSGSEIQDRLLDLKTRLSIKNESLSVP
jgi:hypothetical protein